MLGSVKLLEAKHSGDFGFIKLKTMEHYLVSLNQALRRNKAKHSGPFGFIKPITSAL